MLVVKLFEYMPIMTKLLNAPSVYESRDVCRIVGVSAVFLNQLVERELFGIKPSIRSGESRGSRRRFSREDVWAVALVWWLFEAGLRSGSGKTRTSIVQDVIDQVCGGRSKSSANEAAKGLFDEGARMLAIVRQPRTSRRKPTHAVEILDDGFDVEKLITANPYATIILLPVGNLLFDLNEDLGYKPKA